MSRRVDRGIALLEVMVAFTILALASGAVVGALIQAAATVTRLPEHERRLADASRLLSAVALLSRQDLERRLGSRIVGPYLVRIQRTSPSVYLLTVNANDAAVASGLCTMVVRAAAAP